MGTTRPNRETLVHTPSVYFNPWHTTSFSTLDSLVWEDRRQGQGCRYSLPIERMAANLKFGPGVLPQ